MKNPSYGPVAAALRLLCQSDDQLKIDSGFRELKDLADADDMTAATHLGYAFHFEHLGHYDFNARRWLSRSLCTNYLTRLSVFGRPGTVNLRRFFSYYFEINLDPKMIFRIFALVN